MFWHGQRQPTHIHTKLAGNAGVSACKSNTWNCANHQRHFNHQFLSTRNMDIHLCDKPQVKENNIMKPHRIAAPRSCHTPHTADCLKISFLIPVTFSEYSGSFPYCQQLPSLCILSLNDMKKYKPGSQKLPTSVLSSHFRNE